MKNTIPSLLLFLFLLGFASCKQLNSTKKDNFTSLPTLSYHQTSDVDSTWTKPITKSNEEWKKILPAEQYSILREAATERAFTHEFKDVKEDGIYICAACNNVLYDSKTKFDSGTGWPSFYKPFGAKSVIEDVDYDLGYARTEIRCAKCNGHLGHSFNDGPKPTGLRYCMNGEVLKFVPQENTEFKKVVFAQGCFWCVEEIFEQIKGVKEVISGYSGGTKKNPTYREVGSGVTNHAEAVEVIYDPKKISYKELLKVYYNSGDITEPNGQYPDYGKQYRSAIFYKSEEEKKEAEAYQKELDNSGKYKKSIAVQITPFISFYPAEHYHQNYVKLNPKESYVVNVSIPRYKKAIKNFPELLKKDADK